MKTLLLILLAIATALAATAAVGACAACANPRFGWAGTIFYGAMFAAVALLGPTRLVALSLFAAFGFHVGLLATGSACPLCLASAACSLAMTIALVRPHAPALAIAPWTAALALSIIPPPSPDRVITVYEQPGCPYCRELRERVMPEATRGLDVRVRYLPAPPTIRSTPTIVIGRHVLEGLPPIETLHEAILENRTP